jgi:DNA polymerase-4
MLKNPALQEKAVAVCGDPEKRHGIVLAKSESAKKFGVKTGMPIWQAKQLCPEIIIVSTNHSDYVNYSNKVREIYYRFTDKIEPFGIDECFLDVTDSLKLLKMNGKEIADEIRRIIREEVKLTVSVGVSWNKTYAKLGSDYKKPDMTTVISRKGLEGPLHGNTLDCDYKKIIYPLRVNDMLYVGQKTSVLLEKLNIRTIGDLAEFNPDILAGHIGSNAHKMTSMAKGEDTDEVNAYDHQRTIKSVGNGTTLPYNLTTHREIEQVIYLLGEEVAYRMRKKGVKGFTINLSVRDTSLKWCGAQSSITEPTNAVQTIYTAAIKIFDNLWKLPAPVMSLRVAVSNLTTDKKIQLSFLQESKEDKNDKISAIFDEIRRKYGVSKILFGTAMDSDFKLDFEILDEH